MGLRFRKSINLGGGFKINLSKSGIGYSWGGKGYRVTKKAKGGFRSTSSISGTGISYTYDTHKHKSKSHGNGGANHNAQHPSVPVVDNNTYDTQAIENSAATGIVSEGLEEMIASATKSLQYNTWATIGLIASVLLGERKTQRDVADIAGVTEVTIRNRYKELTEELNEEVEAEILDTVGEQIQEQEQKLYFMSIVKIT